MVKSIFPGPDIRAKYQPTDDHVFKSPWGPFPKLADDLNVHDFLFPPNEPLQTPDYDLFIDAHTERAVSLQQFYNKVVALSKALQYDGANPLGLTKSPENDREDGEILGILSRNHLSWPLLSHSCFRAELVFGGISPASTPYELYHVMRKMQATSLAVHESLLPVLQETLKNGPQMGDEGALRFVFDPKKVIVISDDPNLDFVEGYRTVESLVRLGSQLPENPRKRRGGDKLCYLFQSSGTSGFPKAMMITHKNAIHTALQGLIIGSKGLEFLGMEPSHTIALGVIPAYHSFGMILWTLRVNRAPSTNILMSKWDLELALKLIQKYKVSLLPLVPPLVRQLALSPLTDKYDLSSVMTAGSGAAYLPPDVAYALGAKLPQKTPISSGYGLSEAASIAAPIIEGMFGLSRSDPGSIGHLYPGVEGRIVDPDTCQPVPKGQKGEFWVRSNVVTPGYFKDPVATAELFTEPGWLRTGDLVMRDADDRVHYLDRLKEMIKVKGLQVAATEVEDTLLSHPDKLARDACVAGVDNGRGDGSLFPRAWVVLSEAGKRMDPQQVIQQLDEFVKNRLSKHKHLAGGIEIVDSEMPSAGGRPIPAGLLPGNRSPDGGLQIMNSGIPGDAQQTHSPTEITNPNQLIPSIPPSAPGDSPSQVDSRSPRNPDLQRTPQEVLAPRERSRPNGPPSSKSPASTTKICRACGEPLLGQFVRALGGTYHLACFQCKDCGEVVASKFFPVDAEDGSGQYPLCETDYFRRLNLICFKCSGALRGSYITALDHKYHIEHFTCSVCPTVFGAQDSYYEHEGKVYCHYHYSTQFAQRCNGCQTAILKQFVEIFRNGQNQHWHPECYMIHKFWNVRLASNSQPIESPELNVHASSQEREDIRRLEENMEEKVYKIWSVLSAFEESSAACISDMLLHVSNGAYIDGVVVAKKFIFHIEILFKATDGLADAITKRGMKDLSYGREAKLLCKKVVNFFALLSKTQVTGVRKLGVTQELLALVTGLAHYLKLLIRIGLQGTLRIERETGAPAELYGFLKLIENLEDVNKITSANLTSDLSSLADAKSDCCAACGDAVEDECIILGERQWHKKPPHLVCGACQDDLTSELDRARWSEKHDRPFCRNCAEQRGHDPHAVGGFTYVSKLGQYVYLLRVALARLLAVLRSSGTLPHTSDDPNLKQYEANDGHRISPDGLPLPPQRSNTRSMSYTEASNENTPTSTLEQTVGEMRRLRSTRNERTVSTTFKKARTSRIISGPEGSSAHPGSPGAAGDSNHQNFQIVEERDVDGEAVTDLTFGNQDALTLDDIPRIVAAEQAREQRPNAYKHARHNLVGGSGPAPRLINGHSRGISADGKLGGSQPPRVTKYFSELSALEYFIVRHVAVLSMEPLLENHFNLEELLNLIEPKKPSVWGFISRPFGFKPERKAGKKKGVFGVALEQLVEKDGTESTHSVGPGTLRIPTFIDDAVSAMRQMDMSVEGVFRKNGNIKRLKETAEIIDTKYDQTDLNKENPIQVAALLKKFLREMPDPLLTFKLHNLFVIAQKIPDLAKRKRVMHLTCCLLPKAHRDSMEVLFSFLNWVSSFSHVDDETGSKMDIHNLATVLTPGILYTDSTKIVGVDDSFLAIEAVTTLIEHNDEMCEVPDDLQSILSDTSLFNGSAEITTKEILKRYGDLGKMPVIQRAATTMESVPVRSGSSKGNNSPIATRIDTDPSQATAWQMQRSVRHVQGPTDGIPPQPIRSESGDSYHSQGNHHPIPPQAPMPHRNRPPVA
ncbi:hypothetical protein FQN57_004818 [Myotisia sp. PD_48]|nr:hypothetical protein FQN57_004818 [Myotisia sp. PD_48]